MWYFVIRRVALIVPTLLVVLIISFFMSKLVPGDEAESMLTLQGIHPDSPNFTSLYEKQYRSLNLEKPLFYFSMVPDFYPDNLRAIVNQSERNQIKEFLHQKIDFDKAWAYLNARKTLSASILNKPESTPDTLGETKKMIGSFNFVTDVTTIHHEWKAISPRLKASNIDIASMDDIVEKMVPQKSYFPSLRWHGSNNQFHLWASNLCAGKLGTSIKDGLPVSKKIASAFKWTLFLSLLNLLITVLIAIPTGMLAGYKPGTWFDRISGSFWLLMYAIPSFWLASVLIVYCTSDKYSAWLNIFPIPGTWYIPSGQGFFDTLFQYGKQLILPIICLVANDIAHISRLVRTNVVQQKSKLYVLMAMAKGAKTTSIMFHHVFPNVLITMITVIGGKLAAGFSGALIIEVIFNIPGMGRLMFESIFNADWNVVFGILLIISFITLITMLISDILYSYVNPKIDFES
mgnify:CR=1 FL=1